MIFLTFICKILLVFTLRGLSWNSGPYRIYNAITCNYKPFKPSICMPQKWTEKSFTRESYVVNHSLFRFEMLRKSLTSSSSFFFVQRIPSHFKMAEIALKRCKELGCRNNLPECTENCVLTCKTSIAESLKTVPVEEWKING